MRLAIMVVIGSTTFTLETGRSGQQATASGL